jgi:hypothetical protein
MTSIAKLSPCPVCHGSGSEPDGIQWPSLPVSELTVGLADLFRQASGLPEPHSATISDIGAGNFTLQFPPVMASIKAITRWALRFGGVLESEPHEGEHGPETWCRVEFPFYGVTVKAFAHIPASTAE